MVRREIAPTSQALQVAFSRLFREPMLSESTSFGSRWGIYEMSSSDEARRAGPSRRRRGTPPQGGGQPPVEWRRPDKGKRERPRGRPEAPSRVERMGQKLAQEGSRALGQ